MLFFTALALIVANSPLAEWYASFTTPSVKFWVKDVLMVFFFLVVGMELKREMREGFLVERSQVMLPLAAALGGMIAPALIFLAINSGIPENRSGWAIPSATDIAFALCILMLSAKNIPPAAKIFLLAIAIFDDLGAILIIAAFYNTALAAMPLLLAALGIAALVMLNRKNVTHIIPYMLVGIYLWFCFHHSGIHTTVAGVVLGMAIPMRDKNNPRHSPLNDTMHMLHPWVSLLVLPVFAFTSAGISFAGLDMAAMLSPLPLGIALGLFIGKQIGIFGTSFALIKLNLTSKPEGASWMHLYGVSVIAGIGFTMSLFIGMLAFPEDMQELVKLGVIGGSLLSTLWGYAVLRFLARNN